MKFNATFNIKWRCSICANNRADANIIDSRTIQEVATSGSAYVTKPLLRPRTFMMAANLPNENHASLVCTQSATMDAELQIHHGTALILSGVGWLVTKQ